MTLDKALEAFEFLSKWDTMSSRSGAIAWWMDLRLNPTIPGDEPPPEDKSVSLYITIRVHRTGRQAVIEAHECPTETAYGALDRAVELLIWG